MCADLKRKVEQVEGAKAEDQCDKKPKPDIKTVFRRYIFICGSDDLSGFWQPKVQFLMKEMGVDQSESERLWQENEPLYDTMKRDHDKAIYTIRRKQEVEDAERKKKANQEKLTEINGERERRTKYLLTLTENEVVEFYLNWFTGLPIEYRSIKNHEDLKGLLVKQKKQIGLYMDALLKKAMMDRKE